MKASEAQGVCQSWSVAVPCVRDPQTLPQSEKRPRPCLTQPESSPANQKQNVFIVVPRPEPIRWAVFLRTTGETGWAGF